VRKASFRNSKQRTHSAGDGFRQGVYYAESDCVPENDFIGTHESEIESEKASVIWQMFLCGAMASAHPGG
jgi:hypothetical protein